MEQQASYSLQILWIKKKSMIAPCKKAFWHYLTFGTAGQIALIGWSTYSISGMLTLDIWREKHGTGDIVHINLTKHNSNIL